MSLVKRELGHTSVAPADRQGPQCLSTAIWPDETPQELYVRLKELFAKWTKPEEHTVQQMSEILILEQFMRMVSPDMAVWIKEHDPGTAEEAARLTEESCPDWLQERKTAATVLNLSWST
uniref:SCAN box domain-containing protein n=1 Tax=Pygocentrus nattereri TaxID=42514 RepID=A0AAR2KPR9_PYGNA